MVSSPRKNQKKRSYQEIMEKEWLKLKRRGFHLTERNTLQLNTKEKNSWGKEPSQKFTFSPIRSQMKKELLKLWKSAWLQKMT
jgi:hypothetical protein